MVIDKQSGNKREWLCLIKTLFIKGGIRVINHSCGIIQLPILCWRGSTIFLPLLFSKYSERIYHVRLKISQKPKWDERKFSNFRDFYTHVLLLYFLYTISNGIASSLSVFWKYCLKSCLLIALGKIYVVQIHK